MKNKSPKKGKMEARLVLVCIVMILCICAIPIHSEYYSESIANPKMKEKKTHLLFFHHDTIIGRNPRAFMVAHANLPHGLQNTSTYFSSVFVVDDPLKEAADPTSKVIGHARRTRPLHTASRDTELLAMFLDFSFATGKFNGSSFGVFSQNPLTETHRELAVVGGRGKFRMAWGFAKVKTCDSNFTTEGSLLNIR